MGGPHTKLQSTRAVLLMLPVPAHHSQKSHLPVEMLANDGTGDNGGSGLYLRW